MDQGKWVPAYRRLAEFHFQLRQYSRVVEDAVRGIGMEPQQHYLMLAVKGLPKELRPTITALANRLCLKHHTVVELANRLERRGLVIRHPSENDRREVFVTLTPLGEALFEKLSDQHLRELNSGGNELCQTLLRVITTGAVDDRNRSSESQVAAQSAGNGD